MACRLVNLHKYPLRIDLRGGEILVLPPGQMSRVLREELLYDNCHLPEWEKSGWIARAPARLADAASAAPAAKPPAPKASADRRPAGEAPATSPAEKADRPASDDAAEEERPKSGKDRTGRGPTPKK